MLKAFFDGSLENSKALTLGCLTGYGGVGPEIEAEWTAVREARGNPTHIHMTDLISRQGIYKGWSKEARDHLVHGLLDVFLKFRTDKRLQSLSCSVDLAEYALLGESNSHPSPERLCARIVVPEVIGWYAKCD